jgi:hypothetical protein
MTKKVIVGNNVSGRGAQARSEDHANNYQNWKDGKKTFAKYILMTKQGHPPIFMYYPAVTKFSFLAVSNAT